jgi:hypothetical protein
MIIFSKHAELKIVERRLSRQRVRDTVLNPDFTKLTYNLREEMFKKFGSRHLKVVITRKGSLIIVITAHWVARLPKK